MSSYIVYALGVDEPNETEFNYLNELKMVLEKMVGCDHLNIFEVNYIDHGRDGYDKTWRKLENES